MADINIAVNPASTDSPATAKITLDIWEWTSLSINGKGIDAVNQGNVQFQATVPFNETGPVSFIATANQNLVIVNPGTHIFLAGPAQDHSYLLLISYATNNDKTVTLNGTILKTGYFAGTSPSPQYFSQGRMTGTFSD